LQSLSPKNNLKKIIQDVNKIYQKKENPNNFISDEATDNTKKLIMVQRVVRKFLNLLNYRRTKEMYAAEFNQQFFSHMRLKKINELKSRILTKIKTLNFQEVIKYKKFFI
jgi:hypothetical protein